MGSEASFNVGDAERDGLCTPSSTISAGEKYTKVTRVPTAQSIKYPSTGIVHAPGPSIPAISYSTVPGGFPSSFPATSSSTLDGSNRTDHLQAQGPGTLAFQVPNVVSAQSQATSAAVLEYPGVVNTYQSHNIFNEEDAWKEHLFLIPIRSSSSLFSRTDCKFTCLTQTCIKIST